MDRRLNEPITSTHEDERLGRTLRSAREEAGLSAADVASRLNLRTSFVCAVEDGRGTEMLPEVYVRSHIRSMAALLNVVVDAEP